MSSAAYMTNVSKDKQRGPNQTAPDLNPYCLPLHIHKSIMSANICSRRLEKVHLFAGSICVSIV